VERYLWRFVQPYTTLEWGRHLHFYLPEYRIAERGGCFQRRLFVCQFVCQHDNFRMNKLRTMKLGGYRCIVQKSRPSSHLAVKDQRSRSPGTKKRKSAALCSGAVLGGAAAPVGKSAHACLVKYRAQFPQLYLI